MRIRKSQASLAARLWILATVFLIMFLEGWQLAGWLALGAALGLLWKVLPEEPEPPPQRLPYQHLYRDREFPRVDGEPPPPAAPEKRD